MVRGSVEVWCFIVLLLFILTKDINAQELKSPALDFSQHRTVRPILHHGRTKREITTTRGTGGAHHPEVKVTLDVDGEEHVLDLRLNEDLITDGHVLSYQKDGRTVTKTPTREEIDVCQYGGTVRGKPGSWVAVSTCHGLRGVVYDGKKMRYIEPAEGNEIQSTHYMYDHGDLNTSYHCGFASGVTNNTNYDPQLLEKYNIEKNVQRSRINRYKRSTEDNEVRGPYNSNKKSRYVELVLVADYREFVANGEDLYTVYRQMKDVANIINSVYVPLNIFIALVGVEVWNERDEIQLVENGDTTLNNFLYYRQKTLIKNIPNDNAQLLTRQKFNDGVVGKALKGPICTYNFSGGVATNHSEVIGVVATTIAHEMGHNFGMEHDTEEQCKCPDEKCIMSPSSTSVTPVHWSSCSVQSLALSFERGMDYCLRNKPKRLFNSPTCGNGFVEPAEQCDCGVMADKRERNPCHACCDPDTCMLRRNATCAAGTCCDLTTCRPKSAGTVCRSADKECDLPEYCTGHSEYCPDDVYKMDATPCGAEDQAYCVHGSCRSHTDQCRLLWGATGQSSHNKCYLNNARGNKNGNCGYDRPSQVYHPCLPQDIMCGMLQCRHLNERLEFGMESVAILSAMFINDNGTIIPCRTAIIDLGLGDVDPGLVPDGAKCGEDMMCLNRRCVSVYSVMNSIATKESSVCPSNCSGHGICNSEGHCHCEDGFAPPLCALPGPGGSYDSGPATDPSVQRNFMVAMYIIFLGIIPSILLILLLFYYSRHNVLFWSKKPRKSYVDFLSCKCFAPTSKSYFSDKFSRFQSSTSSLRKLLSFKRNNTIVQDNAYESNEPVYECIDSNKLNNQINSEKNNYLPRDNQKKPLNKINKKITKDDIKIASEEDLIKKPVLLKKPELTNKPVLAKMPELTNKPVLAKRPELTNKPVLAKTPVTKKPEVKKRPNVVIVNQGLTSTTNQMISNNKGQNGHFGKVADNEMYANVSEQIKVHGFKK